MLNKLQLSLFGTKQRILVLGSSISIQDNGYLNHLKSLLHTSTQIEHLWLNASLGGTNVAATKYYTTENIFFDIKSFQPTICFVEKSVNDKIFGYSQLNRNYTAQLINNHLESLDELSQFLIHLDIKIIFLHMYFVPDQDFSWKEDNGLNYIFQNYNLIAHKHCIPSINLTEIVDSQLELFFQNLLLDDYHLNAKGSKIVAQFILKKLIKLPPIKHPKVNFHKTSFIEKPIYNKILSTSLVSTEYTELCYPFDYQLALAEPCELRGVFFVANQFSGFLEFVSDTGHSIEFSAFDHYCWMERLHYLSIDTGFSINSLLTIRSLWKSVDYNSAFDTYYSSAMFDPNANWAITKYRKKLQDASKNTSLKSFSLVCLCFSKT